MREILFLEPVFREMLWGGSRLREFGYAIPSEKTGECWAIAAHPSGDCRVRRGQYAGLTLRELWRDHRSLFGDMQGEQFPLLVKIIDANDDLSIQVHPDDSYAALHEGGALGKTECWYILDCAPGATIVIGHHARDKAELTEMIEQRRWGDFIREVPIQPGDFFQIEPGCLHAIKRGTLILETQQNSDITYRVYDYDRLQDGRPRQLHLQQSMDVLTAPFSANTPQREVVCAPGLRRERLIHCPYYTVEKLDIAGQAELMQTAPFMNVSVIDGQGSIDGCPIARGDHFILPYGYGRATLLGKLSLVVSYVEA